MRNIYQCTRAIAFIGTPHQGSDLAKLGVLLGQGAGLLIKTNKDIVKILKPDSEVLARVSNDFHSMLSVRAEQTNKPLRIASFYEELPIPGLGVASTTLTRN